MTEFTVPVTGDHIDRGTPGNCDLRPIALAILDAIPGTTHATVTWWGYAENQAEGGAGAAIRLERGLLKGRLGEDADRFILAYDDGRPVEPFAFTITIPEEAAS